DDNPETFTDLFDLIVVSPFDESLEVILSLFRTLEESTVTPPEDDTSLIDIPQISFFRDGHINHILLYRRMLTNIVSTKNFLILDEFFDSRTIDQIRLDQKSFGEFCIIHDRLLETKIGSLRKIS